MKAVVRCLKIAGLIISLSFMANSCIDPFEVETEDFENIIVIDASITNEVKNQEIFISRSYPNGENVVQEMGAVVSVRDDRNTTYAFREERPGVYTSIEAFGAIEGTSYTLTVNASDGLVYSSNSVTLPSNTPVEKLEAVRATNEIGVDGVAILVSSVGGNDQSRFYRYEYEETYRIVSLFNPAQELVVVSENPPELALVDKTREERICYNSQSSNAILIADTNNFSENRVSDFQIRFIERRDRIIASRYSILVKQFTQSREANLFYKTLQEFSSNENLFSQTQPGFILGNIRAENRPDQRVLGYFEVTPVVTERLFFNFSDIFGNEIRFFPICEVEGFSLSSRELFNRINSGTWRYTNEDPPGLYNITNAECVDCNLLGSNVAPDFWED